MILPDVFLRGDVLVYELYVCIPGSHTVIWKLGRHLEVAIVELGWVNS